MKLGSASRCQTCATAGLSPPRGGRYPSSSVDLSGPARGIALRHWIEVR